MTDEKKQIEEMARDILDSGVAIEGIDIVFAHIHGVKDSHFERMARYLITDKGYRKERQGGWIFVKDRLPKRNGRYLTHCLIEGQSLVCILYYSKIGGFNEGTVTHWMPLPEAPKMKGGTEQ